jgi:hypothetical protein
MTRRLPKATVFMRHGDDVPWLVAETPSEVAHATANTNGPFIPLTLANPGDDWNGRTVHIRAADIQAVAPPRTGDNDEDDSDQP